MSSRTTPVNRPLEPGSALAGYRIDEVLEAPSNEGSVYVATHLESERLLDFPPWPVALKVFSRQLTRDPSRLREFAGRARLQSRLRHPNIVSIYEVGSSPAPFISMTLFRGPNLAQLMADRSLDDESALAVIAGVASALEAAQRKGLSYRDLRPEGVLVAAGEPARAFLSDFGAGRPDDPEADPAGSVRVLGAMLFELLTGEAPEQTGQALRQLRPELPPALEGVLKKALSDNPRRRQRTPGELMHAVESAISGQRIRRRRRSRSVAERDKRPQPIPEAEAATAATAATAAGTAATAATAAGTAGAAASAKDAPERAESEPKEKRRARVLSPVAIGLGLLVAGAAALGLVLAPDGESEVTLSEGNAVSAASFDLRRPADWVPARQTPRIPGLALRNAVALTPAGADDGAGRALVAGDMEAGPGGVLPSELVARLPRQPLREPVELGAVQAYRYKGLKPRSVDRQLNLYVVPTTANAVVVGCLAPTAGDAFLANCERVASTLAIKGAGAIPLAASQRYARGLSALVSRLNASRAAQRRSLVRARTRGAQAAASRRLGDAYTRARRSAAALTPPPGGRQLHRYIVRHLGRAATSYRRMAAAARARRPARWNAARRTAVSSEQAVQGGIRGLRPLGYVPTRSG